MDLAPGGSFGVTNVRPNSLAVFDKGATGDAAPYTTITGPDTEMNGPYDVAFGPATAPEAPTIDHVTAGFATVTVAFSAPDYGGGLPSRRTRRGRSISPIPRAADRP